MSAVQRDIAPESPAMRLVREVRDFSFYNGSTASALLQARMDRLCDDVQAGELTPATAVPMQRPDPATDFVALARDLAHRAHAGQVDKAGKPYIEHVARVAAAVADDATCEAVAWLHDVLEDCPDFRHEVMAFPGEITRPVSLLTRHALVATADYYRRIRSDHVARRVKLADMADNSDASRLRILDREVAQRLVVKYAAARVALGASAEATP